MRFNFWQWIGVLLLAVGGIVMIVNKNNPPIEKQPSTKLAN